jgi:hypothetical protein
LRPLWLNGEAVHIAEQSAKAAGMPVAWFVESMLFELCGASTPVEQSAVEPPVPGRVIPIGEARGRRGRG